MHGATDLTDSEALIVAAPGQDAASDVASIPHKRVKKICCIGAGYVV